MIRSEKLTRSAKGEDCTLQILGICNHNPETTVAAHINDENHGTGIKANDTSVCFACSDCHDVLDRRVWSEEFSERREWYLLRALQRTLARLFEIGVIVIK